MEDEQVSSSSRRSYTSYFREVFPFYLSIGMTYDLFWNGSPWLAESYREARKIQRDRDNENAWLLGAYVYHAILRTAPRLNALKPKDPEPYLDAPFEPQVEEELTEEAKEEQMNAGIDLMLSFAMSTNKKRLEVNDAKRT